jgi:hypothetical protein
MTPIATEIRVLVEKRGDWWVAQCLEFDLSTQAPNLSDLFYELERLLIAHVVSCIAEGLVPFVSLPQAPKLYVDKYEALRAKGPAMRTSDDPAWDLPDYPVIADMLRNAEYRLDG